MDHTHSSAAPQPIDLFPLLKRAVRWTARLLPLVLILCLVLGFRSYRQAKSTFVPRYESKAVFSVSSGYDSSDIFSSSFYNDNAAAQQLVSVFPSLLSTDFMRDLIVSKLDKGYMNGSVRAQYVQNTTIMTLVASSTDPEDACSILTAVIECYPLVAVYMIENPVVEMIQSPFVPMDPVNTFSGRSAFLSGAVKGGLLGILLIALATLLSQTVTDASELKKLLNVPILATFPLIRIKKRRNGPQRRITAALDPRLGESLRGLRVKVQKLLTEVKGNVVLVTSTTAGEGKTTAAANLALTLSEAGHKVVLVDTDFRHQTVTELFGAAADHRGIMDLLTRNDLTLTDCLKPDPASTLQYISGTSIDDRHYQIPVDQLRQLIDTLKNEFEYVILDTPPCGMVSDTAHLCRYADVILYVVKQDYARRSRVLDAVTALHARGVRVSGCILNGAAMSRRGYGYGYGYGYGSKYGYGRSAYGHRRSADAEE